MKNIFILLTIISGIFLSSDILAQANDLCANATALACGASLTGESTVGATDQSGDIGCSMGVGTWYTFAGTGDNITLSITNDAFDVEVGVASGACGGLTNISCTDGGSTSETVTFSSVSGTTYYIYIGDWSTGGSDAGTFDLAVSCAVPPMPPANDECANAIAVPVEAAVCTGTTVGTTTASTQSIPGCIGTANDDVWFSFVALGTEHNIEVTNTGGASSDIVTEVFDGCGGASLTCQDSPNSPINVTGLTAGQTYYYRVYTWSSAATTDTEFTTCVGSPPPPPPNDECANAIAVPVEAAACTGTTAGYTDGGTQSIPGCLGTADEDVWFSFVATDATHIIETTNTGGTTDIVTEVFDGCSGTSLLCQDTPNSPVTVAGLTPGQTYYYRIYSWSSTATTTTQFTTCVGSPPPPVPGKDCLAATPLCCGEPIPAPTEGIGSVDDPTPNDCSASNDEDNSTWVALSITQAGSLSMNFDATPDADIDFAAWMIPSPDGNPVTLADGCAAVTADGTGGVIDRCDYDGSTTESGFGPACGTGSGCDTDGSIPVNPGDLVIVMVNDFSTFDNFVFVADVQYENGANAACTPPVVDVVDATCSDDCGANTGTLSGGAITILNCPTVAPNPEYSTDGGNTWIPGTPPYTTTAYTGTMGANPLIVRCNSAAEDCPSQEAEVITAPPTCTPCTTCPTAVTVTDDTGETCSGGGTDDFAAFQTAVTTANPLDAAQDPDGLGSVVYSSVAATDGSTNHDGILPTGATTNQCDAATEMVMAYVLCDPDLTPNTGDETYQLVGTYTLTVFPDLSALTITSDGAACGPAVTAWDCSTTAGFTIANDYDANGDTPDFNAETGSGSVTFTVTNSNYTGATAACQSFSLTVNYNCSACPTAVTVTDDTGETCSGGGTDDFAAFQTAVTTANPLDAVQDPSGWGSVVYSSVAATDGSTSHDGTLPTGTTTNQCDAATEMVMAYVLCDPDLTPNTGDETYQLVGTYTLTVFPDLSALTITSDGAACGPAVTAWDCSTTAGFTIANDYDANGDTPDFNAETGSGSVTFTVTNSNYTGATAACQSFSTTVSYNCSACPTAVTATDDTGLVCTGGGTDDLATWQAAVATANPLDAAQDPSGWGSIVYSSVMPTNGASDADGILPDGVVTSPACASSDQVVSAYLLCDPDATPDSGDETYQIISTYTLTVFPEPDVTNATGGACTDAVTDNCGGTTILYSIDNFNTPGTPTPPSLNPGDADVTVSWTATLTGAPAGCEATGTYNLTCPAGCPTATLSTDPIDACNGDMVEVCYTVSPSADGVTLTVEGVSSAVGTAADTELCVMIPVSNTGCNTSTQTYLTTLTCADNSFLTDGGNNTYDGSFDAGPADVYPDPASFVITVTPSTGCGQAPTIVDSTCPTISQEGFIGNPVDGCTADGNPPITGTYSWTQTFPFDINTGAAATCGYVDQSASEAVNGCEVCAGCPTDYIIDCNVQVDEGNQGGISPFHYNHREFCISGGVPPYTYEWSATGYVRQSVVYNNTNGFSMRVYYADNAWWSVTIYDANGCTDDNWEFTNDTDAGPDGENPVLDIESADIVGDNCYIAGGTGSVTIEATGGSQTVGDSPSYEYVWEGPIGWDGTGQGTNSIANCTYGWYSVTVTEMVTGGTGTGVMMGDQTEGWFWVSCIRSGGRGKIDQPQLQVLPNPVQATAQITFGLPETTISTVEIYSVDGRKVATLFAGTLEGGLSQNIQFDASRLDAGVYMLQMTTAEGVVGLEKMVIVK